MSDTDTSRKSPRCAGTDATVGYEQVGRIIECPHCNRPVRVRSAGLSIAYASIPSHGTVETRNTRAADDRMRYLMSHQ